MLSLKLKSLITILAFLLLFSTIYLCLNYLAWAYSSDSLHAANGMFWDKGTLFTLGLLLYSLYPFYDGPTQNPKHPNVTEDYYSFD